MSAFAGARSFAFRSAKHLAESSLVNSGISSLLRGRRRDGVLILAYHNIVPDGEAAVGDLSLHLPQRAFGRQLNALVRTHDIVPLSSIFSPPTGARPRAIITFDDAYTGAVTAGVAELLSRGLPATVFVSPRFVNGGTFWWDEIADARLGRVAPRHRDHCLFALRGRSDDIKRWADEVGLSRNRIPAHQQGASEEQLALAAREGSITVGCHSWSHANLASLRDRDIEEELGQSMLWLRDRFERPLPWVTYPYGLYSDTVQRVAQRLGYLGGLRIDGGWVTGPAHQIPRFALPRLNVPAGLSHHGFELRAAGFRFR